MLLDKLHLFNGTDHVAHYRADDVISESQHRFECKVNDEEIWSVVHVMIILNFLEFGVTVRKIQNHYIDHRVQLIPIKLYLNPCANLETTFSNPSCTQFSVSSNDHNVCKKHRVMIHQTNHVTSVGCSLWDVNHAIHALMTMHHIYKPG